MTYEKTEKIKRREWPARGDFVVLRIKRIMNYGAIADLLEYPGKEGFIHISQVASSWVKNIRSFISEGQMRVAVVKRVDPSRDTVDVSLRNVSAQQEKRKLGDWKREKKADKIFNKICHELHEDFKESYETIGIKLEEEFGELFSVFEKASAYGEEALADVDIPAKWKEAILKHAKKNITPVEVVIRANLILTCETGDGVNIIKKALMKAKKVEGAEMEYVSAPKYLVKAKALDYETAEKILNDLANTVISDIEKHGGKGSFEKIKA